MVTTGADVGTSTGEGTPEYDRPMVATITYRTGVRRGVRHAGGDGQGRYEIAPNCESLSLLCSSYYIIYIIILYKYYIQNIMIVV